MSRITQIASIQLSALWILLFSQGVAQTVSESHPWNLDTVSVSALRMLAFSQGHHVEKIDSSLVRQSGTSTLAELLSLYSPAFIRQYGPGTLATSSFRGHGPEHTAILWNGLNLQSSMNGQQDLSLLPAFFIDEVHLQYGGDGALYGSGAIGGAIHINQHLPLQTGFQAGVNLNLGSFGTHQEGLLLQLGKEKWAMRLRAFTHQAENDFSFINLAQPSFPRMKQVNAALKRRGILQENTWKLGPHQQLDLRLWWQDNHRHIPPIMSQLASSANQEDRSFRSSLQWTYSKPKTGLVIRTAGLWDRLTYVEPDKNIYANNRSRSFILEMEGRQHLGTGQLLNVGINHTREAARTDGYGGEEVSRQRTAAFVSYKHQYRRLTGVVSLREALYFPGMESLASFTEPELPTGITVEHRSQNE